MSVHACGMGCRAEACNGLRPERRACNALLARLPSPDDARSCGGEAPACGFSTEKKPLASRLRVPSPKLSRLPPLGMSRYESRPQKFTVFHDGTRPRARSDARRASSSCWSQPRPTGPVLRTRNSARTPALPHQPSLTTRAAEPAATRSTTWRPTQRGVALVCRALSRRVPDAASCAPATRTRSEPSGRGAGHPAPASATTDRDPEVQ